MSFGAGLAAFSVYHRYRMYAELSGISLAGSNEGCPVGIAHHCPPNAHCQWGVCHCLPGFLQAWGTCVPERDPDSHTSQQPTIEPGTECTTSNECQKSDINLVCKGSSRKQCQCREPTRWNSKLRECQIYIGVDCSHLSRDSPVPEVLIHSAATATVETANVETLLSLSLNRDLFSMNPRSIITPDEELPIPLERTETPEEALNYSLLSFLPTNISRPNLVEGFCRDLEAFSDVFRMEELHPRPRGCPPVDRQYCAVLYDSSTCSEVRYKVIRKNKKCPPARRAAGGLM